MQKIKRTAVKSTGGWSIFFRVLLTLLLCAFMVALGYFFASYFSEYL